MPKEKTKKILITFLIIDIIMIVIFSGLYMYMKKQVINSNDKENQIKNEIKKQESRSLMQDDLNDSKLYSNKIKDFIIGGEDTVGFIKIMENMVSSSNLKFEVKSVSAVSNTDLDNINSEYLKVILNVTGGWNNIQYFLKLLENYPLKIDIDKISLTKFTDYEVKGDVLPQWLGDFEFTVIKLKSVE